MTRVLIAEDSPTIRKMLEKILNSSPDIEVIGTASNGKEAIEKTLQLRPDLVTMDIRMPIMNGFEATKEIMTKAPTPILVISASVNSDDLKITFNAIQAGALDIIEKPRGGLQKNYEEMAEKIIRKVKIISGVKVFHHVSDRVLKKSTASAEKKHSNSGEMDSKPANINKNKISIIGIAASTGGPGTLASILRDIGPKIPVPIVVVQHITKGFGDGFISWLNNECLMDVLAAKSGDKLQPGKIYVAPDDYHVMVKNDHFRLNKSLAVSGLRPYATFLFNSMAENYGRNAMGIVLTGMGRDGSEGLQKIRLAGGITIAQNEESCIVYGMPKEAVELGAVDFILQPEDINLMLKKQIPEMKK